MLTGSALLMVASGVLLEQLQAGDHRLHPRARLLVLGEQLRPFAGQLLLLLPQAAVFLGQALRVRGQALDAGGEGLQLGDGVLGIHAGTIGRARGPVKAAAQAIGTALRLGAQVRMNARQRCASRGCDSQ